MHDAINSDQRRPRSRTRRTVYRVNRISPEQAAELAERAKVNLRWDAIQNATIGAVFGLLLGLLYIANN